MDIFILYYIAFITVYCLFCLITYLHNICFQNDQDINEYEILV